MSRPPFATFVDAGPLVFISGQFASDDHNVVSGDTTAQTRRCLERMDSALRDTGLSSSAVIECMIWLSHQADIVAFEETYSTYFDSQGPKRFITTSKLAIAGALVEIDAIACRNSWPGITDPTSPRARPLAERARPHFSSA